MKTIAFKRFLGAAALAVLPLFAQAQELKIGYVNSERVLRESAAARAASTKIETEFGKREKDLNDLANRLKTASDKFEKDGPTLSEADRNRRQRELAEQDRDLQRKRREFQEDLNQRRNEEIASIQERTGRVIRQIMDSEKYDLILIDVGFAGPRVDITKKVMDALNNAK
ncbi:MAG: OmpH family outer membrane protein [Betaproteobacteria bacterium]|nr:OmpH family outer membrane protein [Betaproteobacteria bacterium]NBT09768.1 OmpH family outer membrane protein [Betaproteobacteria bacterium]NBU49269.1 OmpH family outer membrane protein [Betaproteobacteria bacterium]NBX96585.1 OmpH family outer membrane protein [Betaproteobacteria bacterium]